MKILTVEEVELAKARDVDLGSAAERLRRAQLHEHKVLQEYRASLLTINREIAASLMQAYAWQAGARDEELTSSERLLLLPGLRDALEKAVEATDNAEHAYDLLEEQVSEREAREGK